MSRDRRNGNEFWKLLIKRLEIVLLVRQWSDDTGVEYCSAYAHGEVAHTFTRDPEGTFSTYWNLIQLVLLAYVVVSVPYTIAFDVNSECGEWFTIETIVDTYFVCDILSARLRFRCSPAAHEMPLLPLLPCCIRSKLERLGSTL